MAHMGLHYDLFSNPFRTILEAGDYATFAKHLRESGCTACPLSEGRTNIVVDRGNPVAGIMAIGEGPGEQEDLQGRAFVGRAGKLLDRLLSEAGLDAGRHLLIANVVKCRPPGNRAPQKQEAAACLPLLRKQISLVKPHTILLLGAVAVRHLFPEKKSLTMRDEVGRLFSSPDYSGARFMTLYHPAYLLRDPRKQPDFTGHIGELKKQLKRLGRWPSP